MARKAEYSTGAEYPKRTMGWGKSRESRHTEQTGLEVAHAGKTVDIN